MSSSQNALRDVSDTARWAAIHRAVESERPDALFQDPWARRLAGERGAEIAATLPLRDKSSWGWVMRTVLFDRLIERRIEQGCDLVVNLAAGLDARPYRMSLPAELRWVEVDLPNLIAYKEDVLRGESPRCRLERAGLDLADEDARRKLFERLGRDATNALVLAEGLAIYLSREEVAALGRDLAAPSSFRGWILDLISPGLLKMLQQDIGTEMSQAGAAFRFGPEEGPGFFERCGWRPVGVRTLLRAAARAGRVPFWLKLLAMLPESNGRQGKRVWSAVCLLERA